MILRYLILVAVAIATATAVAGCGSDSESTSDSAAGNQADRTFVAGMIPHHESAVDMAELAQERAKTAFVKSLAEDIIKTQGEEIAFMREQDAELADAGVEMGDAEGGHGGGHETMNADADMAKLESASDFDAEFMKMMIVHHEGAITMARAEQADGKDPELKALAGRIIEAQQREIEQMQDEL